MKTKLQWVRTKFDEFGNIVLREVICDAKSDGYGLYEYVLTAKDLDCSIGLQMVVVDEPTSAKP
jgi:hypothetical protein